MISIIIATYNRAALLPRCIQSILAQTYQKFEIIVIDDGSTDDTEQLFTQTFMDQRIRYIKLPKNEGATYARNRGLEEAKGEYFLVWDSDDYLYPNAFEALIAIHQRYPSVAVVSAPAKSLLDGREVAYTPMPEGILPKEVVICRQLATNHKVKIAKTSLCGNVRYKAKNIDFLVNVEMSERGQWYSYPIFLADVTIESTANSLTVARKKTNLALSMARAPYLKKYLETYTEVMHEKCPRTYGAFAYGASIGFFAKGDKVTARALLQEALKTEKKMSYRALALLMRIPGGFPIFTWLVRGKNKLLT